jgi:1-hydroxycarotenoid 3,4-desaturase
LLVLVNAPAVGDLDHAPTEADVQACEQRTWQHLRRLGLQVTPIAPAHRTCPRGFDALFPATGGALYGAANHRWNASLTRPSARTRLRGLYVAGGSTHPGAGIPMAALSGRLAAAALATDMA